MERIGMALALAIGTAAALAAGSAPVSAKVKTTTAFKHYAVTGETPLEIVQDVLSKQRRTTGGGYAIARIDTSMQPQGQLVQQGRSCRLKNFNLKIHHDVLLPRHGRVRGLDAKTRRLVRAFEKDVRAHELKHRAIFTSCFRHMHDRILRLKPQRSCDALSRQITRIAKAEEAACQRRHAVFDKRETAASHNMPLVAEALEAAGANRTLAKAGTGNILAGDAPGRSVTRVLLLREKMLNK